jgi:hypothetical protein
MKMVANSRFGDDQTVNKCHGLPWRSPAEIGAISFVSIEVALAEPEVLLAMRAI